MELFELKRCSVCDEDKPLDDFYNRSDRPSGKQSLAKLVVDHDHETGKVRGLLCHGCNVTLGHVQDEPERLRRLAEYVERS